MGKVFLSPRKKLCVDRKTYISTTSESHNELTSLLYGGSF